MSGMDRENFTIKLKTFSKTKIDDREAVRTRGYDGAFRIVINQLDHGERSKNNLQITGFSRSNGILEIRIGQADSETGMEVGEQMVIESLRDGDAIEWMKEDYANPRRGERSGRRYKRKTKTTVSKTPSSKE